MPNRLTEEGSKQEADFTATAFALRHGNVPFDLQRIRTIVQHSTDLQPAGPCPCFDWLTGRSAISDREHIQLAETRTKDDMYKHLWTEGPMSSRQKKARQGSWDERLSITFGHKDSSKHWGGISAVAICPSTNDIYTGSRDCRIKRWSSRAKPDRASSSRSNGSSNAAPPSAATNGSSSPLRCIGDLSNHTGWVSALVATPDVLVSASYDASVKIWSARDGRQLANLTDIHDDYVTRLAAAPLSGKFASAGLRGHLHFWDLEALQSVAVAAAGGADVSDDVQARARRTPEGGCVNSGSIYALHCTPDGRLYAFNGPEGLVRLYDERQGPKECGMLRGHRDNVRDVRLSPDGVRLVSAASDKFVRVWDLRAQRQCLAALQTHGDSVWALEAADEELRTFYSGGRDGQVFMTDTKTLLTEPITNAGGPILSLTKDASRDVLWVSTPSSSLSAWPIPADPPTQPVHAIDLQAHPDPAPTDPPHMPSPRAMPLRALSLPRERLPTAPHAEPRVMLAGTPPLVRCAAFEDRRHVLTKDAAGCIALWDLVQGKPVKQYSNDKEDAFEEVYKAQFIEFLAAVPPWFTLDINQGVLTLHLARSDPSAFAAEVYGAALGQAVADDFKYNFGHNVLQAALAVLRCKAQGRVDVDAYVQRSGPFNYYHDPDVNIVVSAHYPQSPQRWRRPMRAFNGDELQRGLVPKWVDDAVMRGRIPSDPTVSKVAFTVEPLGTVRGHFYPAAPAPDAARPRRGYGSGHGPAPERLTAPAILEIRKVALWVQQKLSDGNLKVSAPPVTFNAAENRAAALAQREPHIAILHDGKLLPSELSLNTVKRFLCRGRFDDDIPLQCMFIDWDAPPPLADVVPKHIDPEG